MARSFEKLIDLAINYPVYQKVAETLFRNIIDYCMNSKDRIQNVLKKIILDLQNMQSELTLTRSEDFFETEKKYVALMHMVKAILKTLRINEHCYSESKFTQSFVSFLLNMYRKFQCRTYIEWDDKENSISDERKLKVLLKTIENLVHVFPSCKDFIIGKLVKHWPNCFFHQKLVIRYFYNICEKLDDEKISSELENIIVKQFDKLFLYSETCIFLCAYKNAKSKFKNMVVNENGVIKRYFSFVGFRNCLGKHEGLFRKNELMFITRKKTVWK